MSAAADLRVAGRGAAPSLLEELLAEQQSLAAVDTFARRHDEGGLPALTRIYEERIPVGRVPLPGQQLAFRVDLDACTGCKACVTACHSLNGLAEDETWREVGLLLGEDAPAAAGAAPRAGLQQTVTTACHHCEDPACLAGCPVQAYEKDPVSGIVRHLDDQCIGCQYCVLTCLYDVPKYRAELGIVRKCDMCAGRLAAGEAPACVQGCPNGAITIEIVDQVGAEADAAAELLPGLGAAIPDSAVTRPTTRYVSARTSPRTPADADRVRPAPAHDPLAIMLVLMQLSVGTLGVDVLLRILGHGGGADEPLRLGLAAASAALGLGAATLHLGRPLFAFRAFLGWRTSWMSREIVVFGLYVPAVLLAAAAGAWGRQVGVLPAHPMDLLTGALASVALAVGLAGTACSIMIYAGTHRPAWALRRTAPAFGATLVGLGALAGAALTPTATSVLLPAALVTLAAKVGAEAAFLRGGPGDGLARSFALARTRRLLHGALRGRSRLRFALAACGFALALPALALVLAGHGDAATALAAAALVAFTPGEGLERHLYFTSEACPAMPGH